MSRAFGAFCGGYFLANFVLRWAATPLFHGHGAYGWPKPGALTLAAILAGVLASVLLVFVLVPALLSRAGQAAKLPRERLRPVLAMTLGGLVLFAEVDNTWYALSREHIRWSDVQLFLVSNPVDHFGISISQIGLIVAALLLHAAVLAAAYLALGRLRQRLTAAARLRWRRAAASAALLLAAGGSAAGYLLSTDRNDQWNAVARRNPYDLSAARFFTFHHPDAQALNELLRTSAGPVPAEDAGPPPAAGPAAAPLAPVRHVLVIAIEGWNPRFFDARTMPFLFALKREMLFFEHHYSSGNNTLLGVTGIAFGQSPALFFDQQAQGVVAQGARRLVQAGFALGRFGHGLNSYRYIEGYLDDWHAGPDAAEPVVTKSFAALREYIASHEKTVSLYYYGESHFPYEHAPEFSKFQPEVELGASLMAANTPQEILRIENRYRNTLAEADARLRELFESLPWQEMLVVITGDHGEAMMENGRLSHSSSLERPQIATPMLLYYPGIVPGVFMQTSSHLDILPTVLAVVGAGEVEGLHGTSVLKAREHREALVVHNNQNSRPTRAAIVAETLKVVVDLADLRAPKVVDLLTVDDRPARLEAGNRPEVGRSLGFLQQVLARSGCLRAAGHSRTGPPPLRHCLSGP